MRTSRFLSHYYVVHLKLYIRLSPIVRLRLSRQKKKLKINKSLVVNWINIKVCGLASRRVSSQKEKKGEKNNKRFLCFVRLYTLSSWCVVLVRHTHFDLVIYFIRVVDSVIGRSEPLPSRGGAAGRWTGPHTHTFVARDFLLAQRVKSNLFPLIFTLFKQQFRKGGGRRYPTAIPESPGLAGQQQEEKWNQKLETWRRGRPAGTAKRSEKMLMNFDRTWRLFWASLFLVLFFSFDFLLWTIRKIKRKDIGMRESSRLKTKEQKRVWRPFVRP